ncbi:error-prone DNA polymerase [Belnapia sp. T6]|uniref:Error-prone DNA polymerase n=1 Tax=Belnapia mucosa TaxID=2804532 RepID=A0ABS1V681_9PROT|nr:error-prone DNA polymerase [Belnapia mucosa]MBL6455813.1 error-prone DNA polymerase [Belnapia mucosa]
MTGYAELAAQSNFSFLDGASHPEELAETAGELGLTGLGICDTNSLAGVVRGHVAARERKLPFLVGCRLRLDDASEWLAWPSDRAGYGRLTALLSRSRMQAAKGEARIGRAAMLAAAEGWVLAAIPPADPDAAFAAGLRRDAAALRGRLALPLHLVAIHALRGDDRQRIGVLAEIARQAGARLLATGHVRYHHRSRHRLADVLTAIRLRTTVDALGYAAEPNAERHLKSPTEMARLFAGWPEALANSLAILDACRGFSLDQLRYEYPDEVMEPGRTAQETLASRVEEALAARWPGGVPADIADRIAHELQLIGELGYAPYFLTVHEIVRFAGDRGILCQGRGSAANSAVCYVLGITAVDPGKHDLLFERFVSASRGEPPDIDIDFEHERREEVIQHLYERYGRERAAICATVIRYRTRSAIREVGRAMGLSEDITARLAKGSWGPGHAMGLKALAEAEGLDTGDPRLAMALELAEEILDFPRHLATHVGGFVITRGPLIELAVVTHAAMEGRTVLEWDKDDIDALGILKVDVLGLGMLSCLRRGFGLLRQHHRLSHDLASLPRDCPETYAMLRRADSLGVFQVESRAQMNMLPRLRPEKFYDLVVEVAIVRPGPIQGDMVHPYLRRKQGLEPVTYPAPSPKHGEPDELERVLGKTLGVPLFQEQAMRLAIVAAGFSAEEADQLRRAMATFKLTGGVARYRERLVAGMVRRGYERDFAERVFQQIEGFGSYGFPESHAASFAHLVYASAWVKCHHPAVFACALLNSQPMGFYAPAQIVRDAREHGVAILAVDVNASDWDSSLEPQPASAGGLALRLGLRLVAGLQEAAARAVLAARQARNGAPFASVEEAAWRAGVGLRALGALAAADAFAGTGVSRRKAAWDARAVASGLETLPLFAAAPETAAAAMAAQTPLVPEPEVALPLQSEGEQVVADYQANGLTLGRHPLALLRPVLDRLGYADCRQLGRLRSGASIRLPGLVLMRQRPGSAKGIVFMTVEDEHGVGNLVVYPDVAARDRAALVAGRLLVAEGRIEREVERAEVPITHLIVRRLIDRSDLLGCLTDPGIAVGGSDWVDRVLGRADEVRRPEPGSRRAGPKLPGSRDFR